MATDPGQPDQHHRAHDDATSGTGLGREAPSEALPPGRYEHIITSGMEERLAATLDQYVVGRGPLESAEAADRLALHLSEIVGRAVEALPEKDRVAKGTALIRALALKLQDHVGVDAAADAPGESGDVLHSLRRKGPNGRPEEVAAPLTPLLDTTLLSNARGEPALSRQLDSEIDSADGIDIIVAFIRFSGLRPMLDGLRRHTERGRPLRVLTTTFTGTTERKALEVLRDIGADVRISYDTSGTRLHAKAWIFHRRSGTSTAFIGSSNLTHHAQVLGQEWNVRVSGQRNPGVLAKTAATFDAAWDSEDYVPYDPRQFDEAMSAQQSAGPDAIYLPPVELRPEPFQERLLEQIESSRQHGHHRNLLVSATGTGKTVMAAIDYARLRQRLRRARLLFVAHREEILDQSLATFRFALREPAFGEKWVGTHKPTLFDNVFASIQSIGAAGVGTIDPRHFDVVIVDEFHHAAAPSYEALLQHLRPVELLGLTATPERADGMPILHWFDDRIAAELRVWDAIDQGRLVPFMYYGIHDGLDLRQIPWRRGRGYEPEALASVFTADDAWARRVISQVADHVGNPGAMRALGFCVNVPHAHFMARHFNAAGIRSVAVSGQTGEPERRQALADLRDGKVQAVFSVDLFNEGVDVPAVDTIIMLRPTDSPTVFLQQLGRGLRKSRDGDKSVCTVLDFIGHQHQDFRFDRKLRALLGGTRKQTTEQVQRGFPYLPSGCHFGLDRVARDIVLDNIRRALPASRSQQESELRALVAAGVRPGLAEYLDHTGLELEDVRTDKRGWSELLEAVGLPVAATGPHEAVLRRALGRILHLDDTERIDAYSRFAASAAPPTPTSARESKLLRMLLVSLADQVLGQRDLASAADLVWQHPQVLAELREILPILRDRTDHLHPALPGHANVPLQVHARYSRTEILAAMGAGTAARADTAKTPAWREGVKWVPEQDTDIFVVTLDKTDHFSPTTRYRDYAISRELFHWESQSTTRADSPTGRRYQEHARRGSSVFLFARQNTDERAFWFLGPATYVRHDGERPMAITWRLHNRLPGDLYQEFAAA